MTNAPTFVERIRAVSAELETALENFNHVLSSDVEMSILEEGGVTETRLLVNSPQVTAVVLMQMLADPMTSSPDTEFTFEEKEFWLKVAANLGPDWIGKFRRIGHYMNAVDQA
jgi:hypothetical protein